MQNPRQTYRLRARASGREAFAAATEDGVYVDQETGEEMEPVTRTLPLAPSASALLRTPENLRVCRRCDQLIGLDVSDCPHCGLRQPALDGAGLSRSRLLAGASALVLCSAPIAIGACGDDDDTTTIGPTGTTGESGLESPPATDTAPEPEEPAASTDPAGDPGSGGAAAPPVPDEGHEGGGPDPGTGEGGAGGEDQQGSPSGGAGPSPTESFEQFCEENPSACE